MILTWSPPIATTRLMKFVLDLDAVGRGHADWAEWCTPQVFSSAPFGGLNTTTSPRSGLVKRKLTRSTSTRWPMSRVGTIDSLGIRKGLTRNAWMPRASPRATTTIVTSSTSELRVLSLPARATLTARAALGPGVGRGAFLGVLLGGLLAGLGTALLGGLRGRLLLLRLLLLLGRGLLGRTGGLLLDGGLGHGLGLLN